MNFLEQILTRLEECSDLAVLQEGLEGVPVTGRQLLERVSRARTFLVARGLCRGQRCALLADNGVAWVALDLALMAEGIIVVPLYARQSGEELSAILRDCRPALLCLGSPEAPDWAQDWPTASLTEVLAQAGQSPATLVRLEGSETVTLIYTSGTSGSPKGVIFNGDNISHVLSCTCASLDQLRSGRGGQDRVFHYLPFAFAGSWMMLLSCLLRGSHLVLNSDLAQLAREMGEVQSDYFMNVPALLERLRRALQERMQGGLKGWLWGRCLGGGWPWGWLGRALLFPLLRRRLLGRRLQALICGSAPLHPETQRFFLTLGIPVLQVYGLTETTAICTMDALEQARPGFVGRAIAGVEMKCSPEGEILVRGPNLSPGYWNATEPLLRDGWLATGDQGECDETGNWRIVGRLKNLLVLSSAHKVAPEPLEEKLLRRLQHAEHVVLVGDERPYLTALVSGPVAATEVEGALAALNAQLPHYQQIRRFALAPTSFTSENGLLTANGKLKRSQILVRLQAQIEELYR